MNRLLSFVLLVSLAVSATAADDAFLVPSSRTRCRFRSFRSLRFARRIYGAPASQQAASFTLRVYGKEFVAFEETIPFSTLTTGGVTLAHAKLAWPSQLDDATSRAFPFRVEVESSVPIRGFMTTTENVAVGPCGGDYAPAVSVQLPQ